MSLWNTIFSRFRPERHAEDTDFNALLDRGKVSAALKLMTDRTADVMEAMKHYDIRQHSVLNREDKAVFGKNRTTGNKEFLRWDKQWKIPIPYTVYINEIALVFLYGRPLLWSQTSEGTDDAFAAFTDRIERTRLNAKIRMAKRMAGSETQSAMLFHVYQNDEGKSDLLIKVLAKSRGDDIYFRKDAYDRLTAFARGYFLTESGGESVYHLDFFTKDKIYYCRKATFGYDVEEQPNLAGKIPVILFEQETEFSGVEAMIERKEWIVSRLADVNDRFSEPTLVMIGDQIISLPDRMEDSKAMHIKPGEQGNKADVKYLTWDAASESKKQEGDELDRLILTKSFTPKISYEQISGLTNMSGKALKQLMILANIKAEKRKESHDEYASRIGSLLKAIIGNVLDVRLKAQMEKLVIRHEFQEPFAEDVEGVIRNLIDTYNAGGISLESFVEQNPVVRNSEVEKKRLAEEAEAEARAEEARSRLDLFNPVV
jgi:SPP1 family phage portal protein